MWMWNFCFVLAKTMGLRVFDNGGAEVICTRDGVTGTQCLFCVLCACYIVHIMHFNARCVNCIKSGVEAPRGSIDCRAPGCYHASLHLKLFPVMLEIAFRQQKVV